MFFDHKMKKFSGKIDVMTSDDIGKFDKQVKSGFFNVHMKPSDEFLERVYELQNKNMNLDK